MRRAGWAIGRLLCLIAALRGEQLPIRILTTSDGLASNTIDRIVQDSRGFLWFCTREGLSRFDGYQFRNFGADQGLAGSIRDLIETPDGDYWVATSHGLARFQAASSEPRFEIYLTEDSGARSINSLARDPAGGIWAATARGLYHLDRTSAAGSPKTGSWKLRPVDIGLLHEAGDDALVDALLIDKSGSLWVGTWSGLYRRYPDGRCERIRDALPNVIVSGLLQDRQGRIWVGTKRGLCRISTTPPLTSRSIEAAYFGGLAVNTIFESSQGQLWVGTDRGLSKLMSPGPDGREEFANYTAANGIGGGQVRAVGEDRAGNLWVGSVGANRIAKGGFTTYGTQDGLDSAHIISVREDRRGGLFAVTQSPRGKLVNHYDGHRFHPEPANIPGAIRDWGWGTDQLTFQDGAGEWWVPTSQGVFRFPELPATQMAWARPNARYVDGAGAYRIFQDSRGDVWMSAQVDAGPRRNVVANRLARWERSTGILRDYPNSSLGTAFGEDHAGSVWIGLSSGSLARYRNGRFDYFDQPGGWINAMHADRQNRIWVAANQGLLRIDEPGADRPSMVRYTTSQGLSSNDVECLTEDRWGRIYAGTGRGVDRISPGAPLRIRHYTTADGLARGDFAAAFRDREGSLWFATKEGLSRLDPEPEPPPAPPPILVSAIRVRGVPRPISMLGESEVAAIELQPEQNQVQFDFVGLGFAAGEAMRYQYRLTGNQEWSAATGLRTVNYAALRPGDYRWQVRAVAADGSVSDRPATVAFSILAPIWQRWWVRLPLLIFVCIVLYALYRYRLTRYLEVERLRTRIATDLHDDIGSTLSQIAILSELAHRNSRDGLGNAFSDIADLSRESLDSMSEIVWAIDPEQDRLGDLTRRMRRFASDLFTPSGVQVRFHPLDERQDRHMGPDIRRQLFLIFKECLHNAARHSSCTEVEIAFRLAGGCLEMAVSDNGVGFDAGQVRQGQGLASMRRRAVQLGGTVMVSSNRGSGTSVCVHISLQKSPRWRRMLLKQVGMESPLRRMLRKGRSG
jgi:ligand-binding sensor domain-containing protein/signal transduction histidine kinase